SEIRRAHSTCACRLVPVKLCHLRRRFPVSGSWISRTIAQWPGERSRIWPFMTLDSIWGASLRRSRVSRTWPWLQPEPLSEPLPEPALGGRPSQKTARVGGLSPSSSSAGCDQLPPRFEDAISQKNEASDEPYRIACEPCARAYAVTTRDSIT